jgi:hypothetical protein
MALRRPTRLLEASCLRRAKGEQRVAFEFDHNAARETLHNDTFKSDKTSSPVVLLYPNASAASDVEMRKIIGAGLWSWSTGRSSSSLSPERGIVEVDHVSILSTSWNWNVLCA